MLKLNLEELKNESELKLEFYDVISRIPLNIKLHNCKIIPSIIKFDNLDGGNFIEFRFNKDTLELLEITIVSIDNDSVEIVDKIDVDIANIQNNNFFLDCFNAKERRKRLSIKIMRTFNSICFTFGETNHELNYYRVSGDFYIGLDSSYMLKSFFIEGLSEQNLRDIFGY